jgi:quinol monooxygenase YgiN
MNGGLPMTKYVRIDYVVKPDVALDELKGAIAEFVAGIRAHHPEHRYTSFQHPSDPLRFIHIGEFVEEVLPDLQKQRFFLRFTGHLKEQCARGPDVSRLDPVASTVPQKGVGTNLIERPTT